MPAEVRSCDSGSWESIALNLQLEQNPYVVTELLVWPPFWMQLIFCISKTAKALNVEFIHVLQVFLIATESLVVLALARLLRQINLQTQAVGLLLFGIALNPMAILLVCQHGNFDVIVGLWVLLFVSQLIEYYRSKTEVDWLLACLFVGLGILTKTVPLVLCPMLAGGWRRVSGRARWLGTALVLGPVTLGMSIIYVLAPADVATKVLGYRSSIGWFGISGFLHLVGAERVVAVTDGIFYVLLAAAGAATAYVFWKREQIEARDLVMCAALFLVGVPSIGPGYGSQYLYWYLPLLMASYGLYDARWRRVLVAFGIVGVITYLIEYGILLSHGSYLIWIMERANYQLPPAAALRLKWWMSQQGQVWFRLPLFLAFLALLLTGVRRLIHDLHTEISAAKPEKR